MCAQRRQISLGIRPVWSESSLSTWRKLGSLATHWAHSKDSDQTGRMPRLIWVFTGCTLILLVSSCCGSFIAWSLPFIYVSHKWLIYRVLDHDTYSAHDTIGKVYIDLNPLLISTKDSPAVISGWFPIYDTMHGKDLDAFLFHPVATTCQSCNGSRWTCSRCFWAGLDLLQD